MSYQLNLNPQQTATLKIAISFWKRKEVKDKAVEILKFWNLMDTYECYLKWIEFTKKILDEWKDELLPQKLETESIYIIKIIGKKIFNWYQNIKLKYTREEALNYYIEDITWTPYGTVDEVETFKSYWLNNSDFHTIKVYTFACHHALKDHIVNWWNEMPRNIHNIVPNDNDFCTFDKHILAYWEHRRVSDLPNLMRNLQDAAKNFNTEEKRVFNIIYDLNRSIEENMLSLSVYQGYFNSTKYFSEMLTKDKRDKNVVKCARIAVMRYYYRHHYEITADYMRSQYVQICIFLMNQMSNSHKKTFFNGIIRLDGLHHVGDVDIKNAILDMLLSVWPWQELVIPVLKDMMQCKHDDSEMDDTFFDVITNKMSAYYKLGDLMELEKYQCLFRQAWIIIPASTKQKIVKRSDLRSTLMGMWDLDSLVLILNDSAIPASFRDELIKIRSLRYCLLIEQGSFDKLDQFIEKILTSEEEKKEFKKKINILMDLIEVGKFQLADKLLDWQSSTPEERQTLKNDIDHIKVCEDFITKDDYELLNKFLDWKFNTEEEKRKWKDHFKNNEFLIEVICEIWKRCNGDINSAMKKCSQFLHWLFESEEEIALFKKEMVVNFESNKSNMIDFANLKHVGVLVDFISWCLLDDENFQLAQSMMQAVVQSNIRPT